MTPKEAQKVLEVRANEALPTVFVDNLVITGRTDDLYLVRFTTSLPEGLSEQSRMMIPKERMREMLEVLCNHCDYFPTKKKPRGKAKGKS